MSATSSLNLAMKVMPCMSEYLLLVPERLASGQIENCTVVSHRNHWPQIGELQRLAVQHPCSFIAETSAMDFESIRQMVKSLTDSAGSDRRIVFADDPIPVSLRAAFPNSFCSLLQRVLPCDLLCISTTAVKQAPTTDSMLTAVFRGEVSSSSVAARPAVGRFPQTGPGNEGGNSGLLPEVLEAAVGTALAGVKLSTAERRCVVSGVLLLWDFLHESHEISQTMEGRGTPRTADYWHAIMHRREPDPGNASYWFRRVGSHPALDTMSSKLHRWLGESGASDDEQKRAQQTVCPHGRFDPFAVIELSTQALRKPGQLEDRLLRRVQYSEILNLLAWSIGTAS
ncbi:MAG: hypothetical protein H7Z17_04095 [Fuerstia sp.]|nr:hypothetical protein [Fuerstiella sp.]